MSTAMRRLLTLLLLTGALAIGPRAAQAHPHVWITATSELLYAPDGAITATTSPGRSLRGFAIATDSNRLRIAASSPQVKLAKASGAA